MNAFDKKSLAKKLHVTSVPLHRIQGMIFTIRGLQVMIDRDLADVYGVENKRLNEQVKRNIERFPEAFRFQLTDSERDELVANCDRFASIKHATSNPYAFTEQGVSMLSAVLRSETAIKVSIQIINAFVEMRRFIQSNASIFMRLESVEQRQLSFEAKSAETFDKVFQALEASEPPKQGIFYDGQVFDAHVFVSDLIRKAKKSLILVDNYVDDTVLTLLTKRRKNVRATIFTRSISKQLALDLEKHNAQYPAIDVKILQDSHDRFLIIDERDIYHIGASLKDLGKKWFAFSKIESGALVLLEKLGVTP